jgi:cysteine desulfurase/selenocysteine lyase
MLYKDSFPIFKTHPKLHYLDHAATSHKPASVIEGIRDFYEQVAGSPHRGAYDLSTQATALYQEGRKKVADFIGSNKADTIVFTKNTTEAINMIARSFLKDYLRAGDEIVLSITNHHSNILPFQWLKNEVGALIQYLYCDSRGQIPQEALDTITEKTKVVAIPYISNGIGVKHDVEAIFKRADEVGAIKILDVAQGVGHEAIDINLLNPDFMVFSGHKMYGPQGIGVLYGKMKWLKVFKPFLLGGDMIEYVTEQDFTLAETPKFLEAGTQNVSGVIGLTKAIEFIEAIGIKNIEAYEKKLVKKAYELLKTLDFVEVYGPVDFNQRGGLITFNVKAIHPHDVTSLLNGHHVAIRGGHHCCQPLMTYMKTASTCRASFGIYNTQADLEVFIQGLKEVYKIFYE